MDAVLLIAGVCFFGDTVTMGGAAAVGGTAPLVLGAAKVLEAVSGTADLVRAVLVWDSGVISGVISGADSGADSGAYSGACFCIPFVPVTVSAASSSSSLEEDSLSFCSGRRSRERRRRLTARIRELVSRRGSQLLRLTLETYDW